MNDSTDIEQQLMNDRTLIDVCFGKLLKFQSAVEFPCKRFLQKEKKQ